jgi:hypothetical protein
MREKRQVYSQKNMWEPDAGVEEFWRWKKLPQAKEL